MRPPCPSMALRGERERNVSGMDRCARTGEAATGRAPVAVAWNWERIAEMRVEYNDRSFGASGVAVSPGFPRAGWGLSAL